jgi:hypothetical protein
VMPKETVGNTGPFRTVVGWSKEASYAQLGVVSSDGSAEIRLGDSDQTYDSVWADLTEESIDELIKLLRKVKRQTFGK